MSRPREPLPTRIQDLPELPPAAEAALDDGLAGLRLEIPAAARARLLTHLRLLLAWTSAINLTAIRDSVEAVTLHVVDSLSAVPHLRALGARRLLDIGSGGGYPGLPLAIAGPADALLVESVGKKARFLETAVDALGLGSAGELGSAAALPARRTRSAAPAATASPASAMARSSAPTPSVAIASARAESLARDPDQREAWPLVTARAVAGLAELVELAFPLLAPGGRLVAWKRGPLDAERAAAARAVTALGGGRLSVEPVSLASLPDHVLVVAEKSGATPDAYPRDPAARRRRPW